MVLCDTLSESESFSEVSSPKQIYKTLHKNNHNTSAHFKRLDGIFAMKIF